MLIVNMDTFFNQYKSILPYLINERTRSFRKERLQTRSRLLIEDTTKCILCAACTTFVPILLVE